MIDQYTKAVLTVIAVTVIAVALVWLVLQNSSSSVGAAGNEPQAVFIASISTDAARCIAGHISWTRGDTGPCIVAWE